MSTLSIVVLWIIYSVVQGIVIAFVFGPMLTFVILLLTAVCTIAYLPDYIFKKIKKVG